MIHNLNIHEYSMEDLLSLFDLTPSTVSQEKLKLAKKKVLMLHPDKSKLDANYFLFYKKAYDVINRLYDEMHKTTQRVEKSVYSTEEVSKPIVDKITKITQKDEKKFNDKFNTLFEKHMQTKIDPEKNSWFTQEESLYENEEAHNMSQMNRAIDKVKSRQKEQQLTKYKGVNPLMHSGGNAFYEDDETEYVSSDIFSKLKYDDLRKVHKDETVFSVQDSDMKNVHQYGSVDEYQRARDTHDIQPMERTQAQKWMDSQEQFLQENVRKKQYKQEMQNLYFSDKNKEVMSSFLRIT